MKMNESLPPAVLTYIETLFPTFKLKFSKTMQAEYYADTCPNCGVLSGDFHLHCELGAPFFPTDEEEARCLTVQQIPLEQPFDVEAGIGMGTGDLILKYGNRQPEGK